MTRRTTAFLMGLLLATPLAQAQTSELENYSMCDVHAVGSTTCGHFRMGNGVNNSSLELRERNDTVGLTYLVLECDSRGHSESFSNPRTHS